MEHQSFPAYLPTGSQLFREVVGLEEQLLDVSVRSNEKLLLALLHENFREIGASGNTYTRDQVVELLAREESTTAKLHVMDPAVIQLATDLVQVRWRTGGPRPALRSSLWLRHQDRWRMLFHQGTLTIANQAEPKQHETTTAHDLVQECTVRKLRISDVQGVYEAFISHPDMRRQGDADTVEKAQSYVAALVNNEQTQYPLAITINDRLVGLVCATLDSSNSNAWLWYWMHHEYRGRSLTTRALATMVNYLFEVRDYYRLELGLRVNNPGSRHVAENNGFLREGIERGKFLVDGTRVDVYTYARLRTDPPSQTIPLPYGEKNSESN